MKIAYFAQNWRHDVMGWTLSFQQELSRRGHAVVVSNLSTRLSTHSYKGVDMAFLLGARAFAKFGHIRDVIPTGVPLIGFSLSDSNHKSSHVMVPRMKELTAAFSSSMFHLEQLRKYKKPVALNLPSCHPGYHENKNLPNRSGVVFSGKPRVSAGRQKGLAIFNRHMTVDNFMDLSGASFVDRLNKALIGLDFEVRGDSLSRRIFEYTACGVCAVVPYRPELKKVFKYDKEIVGYKTHTEAVKKVKCLLANPKLVKTIAAAGSKRCWEDHTISKRTDAVFAFLKQHKIF